MATRNSSVLCKNQTKSEYRLWVLKAFHVWLRSLIHVTHTKSGRMVKVNPATIYSLPADLWEFEQFVAGESLSISLCKESKESLIDLHCFEKEWPLYAAQKDSRSFLLNDNNLYRNFFVTYTHDSIHANAHAKSTFGAWYDFCGNPIQRHLDVAIAPQNFVHNSLVFITFDCNVQAGLKVLPIEMQGFIAKRMISQGGKICDHITDATVDYINAHTGNKVKCIMSTEYQGQKHPMMLLGFTNSRDVLEVCHPKHSRIERYVEPPTRGGVQPLTTAKKSQLAADLKTYEYSRDELCDMYDCTASQVGAIIAHHGGGYVTA